MVPGCREDFRTAHPTTAELVIEICTTSHGFDRSKRGAYASAGVKECWLVLGPERQIEAYSQPAGEHYAGRLVQGPGGQLSSQAIPGFTVDLASLFGS